MLSWTTQGKNCSTGFQVNNDILSVLYGTGPNNFGTKMVRFAAAQP
jgi:hypothetical protein